MMSEVFTAALVSVYGNSATMGGKEKCLYRFSQPCEPPQEANLMLQPMASDIWSEVTI
jgi:hypothetical protein